MAHKNQVVLDINICFLIFILLVPKVSANFDKYWCDSVVQSNLDLIKDEPFFPPAFSTLTERSEYGRISEGMLGYSRSYIQFSELSGQMAVESESRSGSFSAFVDSKLNVCLIHHAKDDQCLVQTTRPCEAIRRLTKNLRLRGEKVSLMSARETLGLNQSRVKKAVKVGEGQTRGIESIIYVICEDINNGTATVVSQWFFLDNTKFKVKDNKPVLLMTRHQREEEEEYAPVRITQIDYSDFRQVQEDNFLPNLEHVNSKCISNNMKDVNKTIPIPPASFSCAKETRIGVAGVSIERIRDVEVLHYNYGANWFHIDTFLTFVNTDTETETQVTEDFNTNVRYEISNTGKWCKTFPSTRLSRLDSGEPSPLNCMRSPLEFWKINPDTAVYLGEAEIRGVPCDAWRIGLPDSDQNKTYTIFLATKKWLKKLELSIDTFFPLEYIEQTGPNVKHYSYFGFKDMFCDFVPDISPCFNSNHSVGVRFLLKTSYYTNIQNVYMLFENNLRKTVQNLLGLDSPLQVANIKARPSPADPTETRVSFKVLGKARLSFSFPRPKSNTRENGTAVDSVEKLKNIIKEGKFELKYTINSTEISAGALPDSFFLLREGVCEHHQDYVEEPHKAGYSHGSVAGICILVFLLALVMGYGAVYVHMRRSQKQLEEEVKRPSSLISVTRSVFNMVNVRTEEANWSWS